MPPQEVKQTGPDMAATLDILYMITSAHATCFYPFLRYGMGTHALLWLGPCALILMLGYAQMTHCPLMYPLMAAWLIAAVIQKFLKSRNEDSAYLGWPIICWLVRREPAGKALEPFLVGTAGIACAPVDENFAGFLMAGWLSMLVREAICRAVVQKQVRQMRDAVNRQRQVAELWREMEGR